jgi:serine/threonine protein kinase
MSEPSIKSQESPPTAHPSESPATSPPGVTPPQPSQDLAVEVSTPPGYEILCEIGEGGMGVVYRARHVALDRPVALKYLRAQLAGHSSAVARFTYEARVTARLQHPGIPPVHEVGALPDGRPFLAMKLIQGRTLHDLLREQGPGAGRWLGVFEAICQAVGYAHSQGVIHRDLKPANVMVGAFGEVQVMDWGLAKSLRTQTAGERDETDPWATTEAHAGSPTPEPGTDPTRAGSVLGTPAFMLPEQAIGAIDKLDRRSDVFGLGAILCCLLTGKPPFVAADGEAARQLSAVRELDDAFARVDGCGAEPDLVALAKRCLAAEQEERPGDGGELAQAIASLRRQAEERARRAGVEKERAEVRQQEQSKRRRLLRWAAGLLIAVLLVGVVGTTIGLIGAVEARKAEEKQRQQADAKR